jgi:hypothetical protein
MSNKNVIYGFLVGDYGKLNEPLIKSKGWDYVLFSDNKNLKSNIWDIRPLSKEYKNIKDPKRIAMMHRIEFYKLFKKSEYENIMCVHGDLLIKEDLNNFMKEYDLNNNKYDLAILEHPHRNCVYAEAFVVKHFKLDFPELIDKVVIKYQSENYPLENGLYCTALMVIKNKKDNLREFFKIWSNEYINGSRRDQLSINYSLWKSNKLGNNINVKLLPWSAYDDGDGENLFFKRFYHDGWKGRSINR